MAHSKQQPAVEPRPFSGRLDIARLRDWVTSRREFARRVRSERGAGAEIAYQHVLDALGKTAAAKSRPLSDKKLALELARAFDMAPPDPVGPRSSSFVDAWWLAVARRARELAKSGLLALALVTTADAQTNAELLGAAEALRGLGLIPALADAAPGLAWWCSDRLCSGAGTTRISSTLPAAPCDPWADGRFDSTAPADLACWRQRYAYPFGSVPGSWLGAWCAQHGPCDAVLAQWDADRGQRTWTLGGACLTPGAVGRDACDAVHTGGATLGCTMLPCGIVSCPAQVRTCPSAGGCGAGWRCSPLIELPEAERPPLATVRPYTGSAASDACSWYDGRGRTWVRSYPPCYEGLDATCQTVASLRPACWAPAGPVCGDGTCTAPEGPGSCPADCPPEPGVVEILDCTALGWRVRLPGGEVTLVALGAVVEAEGAAVRVPGVCAGECPAAEVLEAVRAVEGVCP